MSADRPGIARAVETRHAGMRDPAHRHSVAVRLATSSGSPDYQLIETMRYDPGGGIALLEHHLARITRSATDLGFVFDVDAARVALADIDQPATAKVRMLLAYDGDLTLETGPMPPALVEPVTIGIAALPVDARDWRLRHKTTDRAFYDDARAAAIRDDGVAELLFVDPAGWLAEGSFTTLFVLRSARLLTPPLYRGVLPGVLRAHLLAQGRAVEADLSPADFVHAADVGAAFVGNALRGLMRARSSERAPRV